MTPDAGVSETPRLTREEICKWLEQVVGLSAWHTRAHKDQIRDLALAALSAPQMPEEPKRYELIAYHGDYEMAERLGGRYVLSDDYDTLRTLLSSALARAEGAERNAEHWKANHDDQVRRKHGAQERFEGERTKRLSAESRLAASDRDAERMDFLAELTNQAAILEMGGTSPEQLEQLDRASNAISLRYEFYRRTNDTPAAFRLAIDDAAIAAGGKP